MKIKQYIVTYNNELWINKCLDSIFNGLDQEQLSKLHIYIINNHSTFTLNADFEKKVTVLHNTLRPDFSTGHLARNWNQAIINGFQNLNSPDCDILITNQDDTLFVPNYVNNIIELHKKFDFIQIGVGDQLVSYTPNAIKQIGLWDERFNTIMAQESDYFFRAIKMLKEKSTLNDIPHRRLWNMISGIPYGYDYGYDQADTEMICIYKTVSGGMRKEKYHEDADRYRTYCNYFLEHKWGIHLDAAYEKIYYTADQCDTVKSKMMEFSHWVDEVSPKINSYVLYPYFEFDISKESLAIQKYLLTS